MHSGMRNWESLRQVANKDRSNVEEHERRPRPVRSQPRIFTSPDRFISMRPPQPPQSPLRLSRPITRLTPRERYARQRDHSIDPFRSASGSRSRASVRRRPLRDGQRTTLPHLTPSFVQGNDATPHHIDANGELDAIRQISTGAVWNVGGRSALHTFPTAGVPDGRGGLLGSGTNAPMYTAHFLDHDTLDQDWSRHENRLALALDVDQASRILSNVQSLSSSQGLFSTTSVQDSTVAWRDNAWTWHPGRARKSLS